MKKTLIGMAMCALALAGCGNDDIIFDEPEPEIITAENDPALEKLARNVGFYCIRYGELARWEFAYRAAGQYCIFPMTEARAQQLEQLDQQEGAPLRRANDFYDLKISDIFSTFATPVLVNDFYVVTGSRDFITSDDYVSDMYFFSYYSYYDYTKPAFFVVDPRIVVCVPDPKTKDTILKDYRGKLTESTRVEQGMSLKGGYRYEFDCTLKTSEEVMNLADKIYRRNDVTWAEAGCYKQ